MLKEKLFKFLFPKKSREFEAVIDQWNKSVANYQGENVRLVSQIQKLGNIEKDLNSLKGVNKKYLDENAKLKAEIARRPTMADLMRDSLGLPMLTLDNIDADARPPHYLEGLTDEERKNYVAHLESIYADEKFQTVYAYSMNLIGNHMVHTVPDEQLGNGRVGIVSLKMLMKEFENAHDEFISSKKPAEEFDPMEIIPK